MFMMVSKNRCPNCGVVGKYWKKKPEVFICPVCETIFNEFMLVKSPKMEESA